ncbi:DivIVA domain-containing protein [Dermabacter sp. p3-SID358]|uniref:DivIVA domain-containing protein n=1 Tax=Dermabacter sp. p3-SID358 TaxID=2916114 RepID=UPI0021A35F62|nr:DivIVA domain-containing protein [Dermabacter sp. p3-SID358]MCT1867290.1 DivIVA domain-containing protein [Dermabacter sp. p3-SID358]
MALMPKDLEDKRFTPVRFTEGYDMDEVDKYLDDDVIPRLRELIEENDRLKRELEEAQSRVAELEARVGQEGEGNAAAATVETEAPAEQAEATESEPEGGTAVTALAPASAGATRVGETDSASELIALAQRLHDEHIANGQAERDRLISEGTAEHERIIKEANETSRTTLERLESTKSELEKEIESLRTFERDYRTRLRNYLENQLRDLDTGESQEKAANYGL